MLIVCGKLQQNHPNERGHWKPDSWLESSLLFDFQNLPYVLLNILWSFVPVWYAHTTMHFLQVLDMKIWMNNIKSYQVLRINTSGYRVPWFLFLFLFFQFCEIGGLALFIGCTMLATIKKFNFGLCAGS